jgi:hypothetical protein
MTDHRRTPVKIGIFEVTEGRRDEGVEVGEVMENR